ncbi:MAG TPA: DUF5667 domain-containing protein [Ktedonobacterales bacterium]
MSPKLDRTQQLNEILDEAENSPGALQSAAQRIQTHDPELASDLRLIAALRNVAPARPEMETARLAIGQRLTREILAESGGGAEPASLRTLHLSEPPMPEVTATNALAPSLAARASIIIRPVARWARQRKRAVISIAVAAAILLAVGVTLSMASVDSLPGSPLYGLKLSEESFLLALPLGPDAHAQVLSMVAMRRLHEAQAEAQAHHDAEAQSLLNQYNQDMIQLITLAASVNAHDGDSSAITAQISQLVLTQDSILRSSTTMGDSLFQQALSASAATVQQTLQQQHIALPNGNAQNNDKGRSPQPTATATATPTPSPQATPTPPGVSGSHGHGHHHGGGGSNNQ